MSFNAIPILDLALSRDEDTKPAFLTDLRRALIEIGFLYISNTGIDDHLIEQVIQNGKAFFSLSEGSKLAVQMKNQKSFLGRNYLPLESRSQQVVFIANQALGYSLLGGEITAKKVDWREQIDLSTNHPLPSPGAPLYHNLRAPNQWPSPDRLPQFRPVYERYIQEMSQLSTYFTSLIAEALGLASTAFDRYFDGDQQQHKLKIVRYPDLDELNVPPLENGSTDGEIQGVGPHKDSMLTSYLLQASHHRGLQAQNVSGEWIDCPPRSGTLVVAIGQGLEALTHGVCASTTHRVLAPGRGQGSRFSIPFFQGVSCDAQFESVNIPEEVQAEKRALVDASGGRRLDDVEFAFVKGRFQNHGEATLWFRCKSHEDVAQKWYPELWKRICEDKENKIDEENEASPAQANVQASLAQTPRPTIAVA